MPEQVTDARSNSNDQIAHAVKVIGRSKDRLTVFLELHSGRQKIKTASQIAKATGLSRKRVLEEGKKLAHKQIINQTTRDGDIAYQRDDFLYANKTEIVRQRNNPKLRKSFPTKYNIPATTKLISIKVPSRLIQTATVTVDDIDSFKHVKKVQNSISTKTMKEKRFKRGIQSIIKQKGTFTDWGGEQSDLFTTRLIFKGKRISSAFAFKGRATKGMLTPGKLGKNGDQIQRLFTEDAEIFFIQYHSEIASSVIGQMSVYAQAKSLATGKKIYYGIIDGVDSGRLFAGYPKAFK